MGFCFREEVLGDGEIDTSRNGNQKRMKE
jgi:hypothetical protein